MTDLNTSCLSPESREAIAGDFAYGHQIRCIAIRFSEDIIYVDRKFSINSKSPTVKLDFAEVYLPPNGLYPGVTLLKDRPDLARIVVAVIDNYMLRCKVTKSTATTALSIASNVIRFIEYCWLNHIYHLGDVGRAQWDRFLADYASGGWFKVLNLEARVDEVDFRLLKLKRRKGAGEGYSGASLLKTIGANVEENQIRLEYVRGESKGSIHRAKNDVRPSESLITQLISQLNNLVDLPKDMRAQTVVHPNPYIFAKSVSAIPPERTENFEPAQLGSLIAEAFRWVNDYGPLVVQLLEKVYEKLQPHEEDEVDETRMMIMLDAAERKTIESKIGARLTSVRRNGTWSGGMGLLGLTRVVMASCFLILGVFNGRRKDEVHSKAIGVYSGGFSCLDEDLGIYACNFYCEKTTHDYKEFYVNEISFKALELMKRLSDCSWGTAGLNNGFIASGLERKLFCMPPRSTEHVPIWYDFSNDEGIVLLTERATGAAAVIPNAHMFRRAYAVVFMYRYENADLYALSQQLDHRDLSMTCHYIMDTASRALARHAAKLFGDGGENARERAIHAKMLTKEVDEYAQIKLQDDILEILSGRKPSAGGFGRLVQRFARKMLGKVRYDDEDLRKAAGKVSKLLIARGHTVNPLRHGNCNAGPAKSAAKCHKNGRLHQENASPVVCGDCPYHLAKENHIKIIAMDLVAQRQLVNSLPVDSVLWTKEREALSATEALINFYSGNACDKEI